MWRSYDEPGGIEDEIRQVAADNRNIVKLVKLGETVQGRDILALKVTKNARSVRDGARPAVVYAATQHAREWISTEVCRRMLHRFVDLYGQNRTVTRLVNSKEFWFLLVANPDGYQYTFDGDRLWRKNLRDNNVNGTIEPGDGVDPNRNFPNKWNYDDEGSSSLTASETYRGTTAASERETRAYMRLLNRADATFLINYHSYGNLLLYSFGWQVQTTSADDPIFKALAGTDDDPAVRGIDEIQTIEVDATGGTFTLEFEGETTAPIAYNATAADIETALEALDPLDDGDINATGGPLDTEPVDVQFTGLRVREDVLELIGDGSGLTGGAASVSIDTTRHGLPDTNPGVGADLYTTNGETTDYAHSVVGTLAFTPELDDGEGNGGFIFPDDEAQVQAEYRRHIPFAINVALSAHREDNPVSHLGVMQPMIADTFVESWGDPQTVQVTAQRSLGPVVLKWRVNSGPLHTVRTREWRGGERYGDDGDVCYRVMRGRERGTRPGDRVTVWFEASNGEATSDPFIYRARKETGNDVLVMSAEDYSGISQFPAYSDLSRPNFLSYYVDALSELGIAADVYDVDANGRTAPDALGVLSHYDTVIWYTANDNITREPGGIGGVASTLANHEMLEVRQFMNEGGRVLYTGKSAGRQHYLGTALAAEYAPNGDHTICDGVALTDDDPIGYNDCIPMTDDFHQYYLGGYIHLDSAGVNHDSGELYPLTGSGQPLGGLDWLLDGADSADNQNDLLGPSTLLTTSSILKPGDYPQFESWASSVYETGVAGAFDPHGGLWYLYSQRADQSYKRLMKTIDLSAVAPTDNPTLTFWSSTDTEPDWDFLFVEAHTPGQDDNWTTLPDENELTTQETGQSCASGWTAPPDEGGVHPWLQHYQTLNPDGTCTPTGSSGDWHAATGNSNGWHQWSVDLSDYAGGEVELSISYASDWGTQGLGVWLDDLAISAGGSELESTGFEADLGGWEVAGPPEGSGLNANDWIRTENVQFELGSSVSTDDSIYMSFGFEGVQGADKRAAIMRRAMNYLRR